MHVLKTMHTRTIRASPRNAVSSTFKINIIFHNNDINDE